MKKKGKPPAPVPFWGGVDLKKLEEFRKERIANIIAKFKEIKDKPVVQKIEPIEIVPCAFSEYDLDSCYTPPVWCLPKLNQDALKRSAFADAQAFGAHLERRGFKRLGSGAYSTVYAKDGSDKVIKVTRRLDDWIDYIQWAAKEGYAGTFAPKVYSWKKFAIKNPEKPRWGDPITHFSVAIVERMEYEMSSRKGEQSDFVALTTLSRYALRGNVMCQLLCDEIAPGYAEFYKKLGNAFGSDDMHGGNIMVRPNNTFCVTDPVCGHIRTSATRLKVSDFTSLAKATFIRVYFESSYRHRSEWVEEPR